MSRTQPVRRATGWMAGGLGLMARNDVSCRIAFR